MKDDLTKLRIKLDLQAIVQLRTEVNRLNDQIETLERKVLQLTDQLESAEQSADSWQDIAYTLIDSTTQIGITKKGDVGICA